MRMVKRLKSKSGESFGFTLIEILVVLLLIGIISLMVFPRITFFSPDSRVKDEVRRFAGTVRYLRGLAATGNCIYKLYLDLDERKYWVVYFDESGEEKHLSEDIIMDVELETGVSLNEVRTPGKLPVTEGQTSILFYGSGEVEASEISFKSENNRILHLKIHPLTGRCEVWWQEM